MAWTSSCNTNGCLENRNSVPYAGFYDSSTGSSITLDSVQIYGLGMEEDNPLSAAGTKVSALYLPMRSTQLTTGWILAYKWKYLDYPELNDTVIFDYTSTPRFASEECGVIYNYHITHFTYTTHLLDSVVVTDSLINNIDIERIRLYFRTSSTDPDEQDPDADLEDDEDPEDPEDLEDDEDDEDPNKEGGADE